MSLIDSRGNYIPSTAGPPPGTADSKGLSGSEDPTGSVTPDFSDQLYHRTSPDSYYRSTGITASDWVAIGGGGDVQDMQVAWTPTNVKLAEYAGPLLIYWDDSGITALTSSIEVVRVAGVDIEDQASLASISLPNLTSVANGTFNIKNLPALTSFSAPLLASVLGADVEFSDTGLVSLSLPSLVTIFDLAHAPSSGFSIDGPSLTTVSIPAYVPFNGAYIYTAAPLSSASVNHILARHVANAAYVSGDISMTDGGEAAPTGQGLTDKATLIGRGVTVATN